MHSSRITVQKLWRISYIRRVVLFGIAGVVGFIVDSGLLYLLKGSLGLYYARAVSFLCAAFVTWLANRSFAFKGRSSSLGLKAEFLRYLTFMLFGGLVNYCTYAYMVMSYELVERHPIIGVAAGSILGMFVNLLSSRFFIFRFKHSQ